MRTSGLGEKRGSSTSGVLPIDSTILPKRPPQGRLSSSSRSIVSLYFKKYSQAAPGHENGLCAVDEGSEGSFARFLDPQFSIGGNLEEQVPDVQLCSRPWRCSPSRCSRRAAADSDDGSGTGGSSGGETLTVGSDIPYPPFEQGKAGQLHRLRHRTGGSDRRKNRPHGRNSRTPPSTRSSATSPRASSKRSPRRRRSPTNARKRSTSPTPTTSPNRRSWSKRAARSTRSRNSTAPPSGSSRARPVRNSSKKKSTPGNSAPTRRARRGQRAEIRRPSTPS